MQNPFPATVYHKSAESSGPVQSPLAHIGALATPHVSMPDAEAIALAKKIFGIAGCVTRFATEKDDTFRLDSQDGRRYILKVANPSETEEELWFQTELLQHIARVDPFLPIPCVIAAKGGQLLTNIADEAGQHRCVRLMAYLTGTPLDSTSSTAREREQVGVMLGRLRLATAGFSHASDSRVLAWDVRHLPSLAPLLEHVAAAHQRSRLEAGLLRLGNLTRRIAHLRTQVLHNDFSKSNIVVDHARPEFVTGIIDFGDAVRTAIAIDVSTALLNQLPSDACGQAIKDLFAHGRDVLHGYLRVADLMDDELELIPHLVMGRVITRALITLWRARLFPHNQTYILRNTEQGWAQLDWFLARSVDDVSSTLLSASA